MTDSYQAIERTSVGRALYVADDADHIQWITSARLERPDVDLDAGEHSCDECAEVHLWRKVYVRA